MLEAIRRASGSVCRQTRTNADVLKPWVNGMDLTRRPSGKWITDFGRLMSEAEAALYEEPFRWIQERVYPFLRALVLLSHHERIGRWIGGTYER